MMPWLHDLTQERSSNSLLLSWRSLGSQLLGCFFSYKELCIVAYISIVARTWSLSSWRQGHLCACPAACSVAPSMLTCPTVIDRTAQALAPVSYLTLVCTELAGATYFYTDPVPRSCYLSPWPSLAMLISKTYLEIFQEPLVQAVQCLSDKLILHSHLDFMWFQMVTDLWLSQDKNPIRKSQWQTRPHGGWMDLICWVALIPAAWHGADVQQILTDWHNSHPINSMASQGWFSYGSATPSRSPGSGNINKRPSYVRLPILSGLDYTSLFPFWISILLLKKKKSCVWWIKTFKFQWGLQRCRLKGSNTAHNCKLTIQKGMELRYRFDTNISSPSLH